jgi:hypothetical protein
MFFTPYIRWAHVPVSTAAQFHLEPQATCLRSIDDAKMMTN